MKVKVVIRDGRVPEVVMKFDRLPRVGDVIKIRKVGEVKVTGAIKVQSTLKYEGAVVAVKVPK